MKSRQAIAVVAVAFLVPVILVIVVFPTPMIDTRELLAWGRLWPLVTAKHPPMMAWLGGVVDLTIGPSGISAVVANQLLSLVAVIYIYRLLRMIVDRERAILLSVLFATTVVIQYKSIIYALNADLLEVPTWLAVLYHFARARRTNSVGHWIGLALWAAAAALSKYTAFVFFAAIAGATLLSPDYRKIWKNPRLYAAAIGVLILLTPLAIGLLGNDRSIGYVTERFGGDDASHRIVAMLEFLSGAVIHTLPGCLIFVGLLLTRSLRVTRAPVGTDDPATADFLILVPAITVAVILVVDLAFGFNIEDRYIIPCLGIAIVGAAPHISLDAQRWPRAERLLPPIFYGCSALLMAVVIVVYIFMVGHDYLQEPAPEAAAIIKRQWSGEYPCGPGYFLGEKRAAQSLALAASWRPYALTFKELDATNWLDPAYLARDGAVVVYEDPALRGDVDTHFPALAGAAPRTLTLKELRNLTGQSVTYSYFFIPPRSCDGAG